MDHFLEETEEMAPEYMNDSFERDDEEEVDNLMREIFGDAGGHEEMEDQDRGNEEENIGDAKIICGMIPRLTMRRWIYSKRGGS